jgi:NADH-quinone oxidoreductase subunit C
VKDIKVIYEKLQQELSGKYQQAWDSFGMLVLEVSLEQLLPLVERLKSDFAFDLLLDITAVDYQEREQRFELVYHLFSGQHRKRVRIKASIAENETRVPTVIQLYGSANYLEREVHEMYGISFDGNDDLRPILLYEGFEGHPLRKDYRIDHEQPIVPYRK